MFGVNQNTSPTKTEIMSNKLTTKTVPQGIYRHYKGSLYQVLHTAHHSETEKALVVYRCLYGNYDVWVRPLEMFVETVTVEGQTVPRFELIQALAD
ncbi:hypothetical protein A1019T_00977 [Psychrobacter pasteurii]|uniref:DUF1653 domain-containing protein n=2 Tax=Psychrobacter pasteurii TaxID=1945520 RepID=A0A1R4EET5_9GAMM|nr:hypothetical protein A1019T_00977 [Psychrobacter pasteurii]